MDKHIIHRIVKATGVKPGELILVQFWGEDEDIEIMHSFAAAVVSLGASPLEMQQSRSVNAEKFSLAKQESFSESYFKLLSDFDAVIDIFNYHPVLLDVELQESQSDIYKKYMMTLFGTISNVKRFTQIRMPSKENAPESYISYDEYTERMMSAYDIDYDKMLDTCKSEVSKLKEKSNLTLTTGGKYDLQFNLLGREWHMDAGDGDLPCGEVYIAPLESETNGEVYFDTLYAGHWGTYNNLVLNVKNGVVISASDKKLNKHFDELDAASKTICEIDFGLNPNVKTLCGYTPLDEKACGSFHIAIGSNTMFGGKNEARLHMDFVGIGKIK